MKFCLCNFIALVFAILTPLAFAEGELQHDPFIRPQIATSPQRLEGSSAVMAEDAEVPWNPRLTSMMLAGKYSMVNVDGVILKIGESIDGYRLIQVRDAEAVFMKGKKRIVLNIGEPMFQTPINRIRK